MDRDVSFAEPEANLTDQLDAAYRSKYGRYGASIVNTVVTPQARSATIKLVARP